MTLTPRYPVYIPSKGRYENCITAKALSADGVPFYLVVEPQEHDAYASAHGADRILTLPFSNPGSVIPARNWIKQHATEAGYARHWQLDDNMRGMWRVYKGHRFRCDAGVALSVAEDFTDRFENVAICGLNYYMFYVAGSQPPPFYVNHRVYSCSLILNSIPNVWRGRYNEDTDICLQVLADGWCTVLINAFLVEKIRTMTIGGGNTASLYQGDGRLRMARSLERLWPGVVSTRRRFKRPQHVVRDEWRRFDTPLRLKAIPPAPRAFDMTLTTLKPIKSERLQALVAEQA